MGIANIGRSVRCVLNVVVDCCFPIPDVPVKPQHETTKYDTNLTGENISTDGGSMGDMLITHPIAFGYAKMQSGTHLSSAQIVWHTMRIANWSERSTPSRCCCDHGKNDQRDVG